MTDIRFPRIVGFEVPNLQKVADPVSAEPIVGLLNIHPSKDWVALFDSEVSELTGHLGIARFSIEDDRLLFFGSIRNPRRLCEAIRELVERISRQRQNVRLAGGAVEADNLGESSFLRND